MNVSQAIQMFLNREPIEGVRYWHNDYVRIVAGENAGESGSLVSVIELTPEPVFLVELESGFDVQVRQSEVTVADF